MPQQLTYPGVYIEEVPSGVHTITGVSTSTTAFVGRALRGPVEEPIIITSFGDYERAFGGLAIDSTMSYAVNQYFLNGGSVAIIVRLFEQPAGQTILDRSRAKIKLANGTGSPLVLIAVDPGTWGNNLRAAVDHITSDDPNGRLFNLTLIEEIDGVVVRSEQHLNVTLYDSNSARYLPLVLEHHSNLMRAVTTGLPTVRPNAVASAAPVQNSDPALTDLGNDGAALTELNYNGVSFATLKRGIYALEKTDIFNILCVPPLKPIVDSAPADLSDPGDPQWNDDFSSTFWDAAAAFCARRRAVLLVNPALSWNSTAAVRNATSGVDAIASKHTNAAVYFPNIELPDPLRGNRISQFSPCGAVAGVMARTDAQRGVWKAPAGVEAGVIGTYRLAVKLSDGESGQLNPLGVNCLRTLPAYGHVVWGARTLRGADRLASEWKYLPVRRLAYYLEESLYRGTQWAVFEANDEPLWAQLRMNVGAFMHELYRQGAFQGLSPREAYFVKCDAETNPQGDINKGIVNVLIGFAPLKPAEFVVLKIQQIVAQPES